jgi:hypothetical protein
VERRLREATSSGMNDVRDDAMVKSDGLNVVDFIGSGVDDVRNGVAVDAAGRDADVKMLVNTNSLLDLDWADLGVDGDVRVKVNGDDVVVRWVSASSTLVEIGVDDLDRCEDSAGDVGSSAGCMALMLLVVIASDVVVDGVINNSTRREDSIGSGSEGTDDGRPGTRSVMGVASGVSLGVSLGVFLRVTCRVALRVALRVTLMVLAVAGQCVNAVVNHLDRREHGIDSSSSDTDRNRVEGASVSNLVEL